jgi:hypothetical protein
MRMSLDANEGAAALVAVLAAASLAVAGLAGVLDAGRGPPSLWCEADAMAEGTPPKPASPAPRCSPTPPPDLQPPIESERRSTRAAP